MQQFKHRTNQFELNSKLADKHDLLKSKGQISIYLNLLVISLINYLIIKYNVSETK